MSRRGSEWCRRQWRPLQGFGTCCFCTENEWINMCRWVASKGDAASCRITMLPAVSFGGREKWILFLLCFCISLNFRDLRASRQIFGPPPRLSLEWFISAVALWPRKWRKKNKGGGFAGTVDSLGEEEKWEGKVQQSWNLTRLLDGREQTQAAFSSAAAKKRWKWKRTQFRRWMSDIWIVVLQRGGNQAAVQKV